jgi:hypothetical protein
MSYDNWKLETPSTGEWLYKEHYESLINDYCDNEATIIDLIVGCKESLYKVKNSDSIVYTSAGGYFERQKDLLRIEHRLHKLKAMHIYIIEALNKYTKIYNDNK